MAVKQKISGKGLSIPAGIVFGVFAALAFAMLGALLLALLVMKETVPMSGIGVGAMVIVFAAAVFGCWLASVLTNGKKLLVCALTGIAFFLILLSITAVFFDGVFEGIGISAVLILLGTGVSVLFGLRKKSGKSKFKIPVYR